MKYVSVNHLSDFDFHDAEFAVESMDNDHLTVGASYLNIHKNAEQNPYETDMEIEFARITFNEFNLKSYEPGRAWKRDENGNPYSDEPQIILSGNEAHNRFVAQLKSKITVFDLGIKEENTYFIDATAVDPFFTVCFAFKSAVIEWDNYKKEAWYVSTKG